MISAAMNVHMQVFVWTFIFCFLEYIRGHGIAESRGNSVPKLRECRLSFREAMVVGAKWYHVIVLFVCLFALNFI